MLLMKASDRGRNVKFLGNNFGGTRLGWRQFGVLRATLKPTTLTRLALMAAGDSQRVIGFDGRRRQRRHSIQLGNDDPLQLIGVAVDSRLRRAEERRISQ